MSRRQPGPLGRLGREAIPVKFQAILCDPASTEREHLRRSLRSLSFPAQAVAQPRWDLRPVVHAIAIDLAGKLLMGLAIGLLSGHRAGEPAGTIDIAGPGLLLY